MMGANILVESEEDKGSEFYFTIKLPIVDSDKALCKTESTENLKIQILYSKENHICTINDNISTYLGKWQCDYSEIYTLDNVNEETDILIICAKLFDKKTCKVLLDTYENLQLLYIEGIEDNFNCTHSRFHLIEQPLTGSAIFDKLISFTKVKNSCSIEDKKFYEKQESSYNGTILVAEDNETNQMLISIMLEERGLEYTIAANGQIAVDEVRNNDIYDLIFMDINMPILDGIKATKALREDGYTKPIVSLSANVIESDIESFYAAGMDATLNKPLVPQELDMVLKKYLTSKKEKKIEKRALDTVSLKHIAKVTAIANEKVLLKLLLSFAASTEKIIHTLNDEPLNKDILHNIKGMSGNLRFENIAKLAENFEESIEAWSDEEHKEGTQELLRHLNSLVQQIEELK
jgi:CheY-like chemotaxis protein